MQFLIQNLEELRNSNCKFKVPNIEISGSILMYAKKDVDKLIKLLFGISEKKDYLIPIKDADLEEMIVEKIIENSKNETLDSYKRSLETMSSLIYHKHLREGDDRVYTRLDYTSKIERNQDFYRQKFGQDLRNF